MPPRRIQFGAFELDPAAGELRKHGIRIKLQEQPFQILHQLLEHPGEVVTREELQKRIWPADSFVDFDHGLYSAVQRLRDALSDTAETPRYVETLPRRGYRFIAAVNKGNHVEVKGETASVEAPASIVPERLAPRRSLRIPVLVATGAIVVALLVALAFKGGSLRELLLGKAAVPPIHSLAVLPIQNLSGDPNQEYFADGMTEELITELSRLSALKVISRTSVMRYKKSDKSLPEIARELNVDAIVEGSVLRSGDWVRITAQLIYARTDANVWAETYDRNLQDTLAVQETVAIAIAGKLKASLIPTASRPSKTPTVNLKAHEAYLRGLHERILGDEMSNHHGMQATADEHHRRAVEYFRQAIQEDPNYAAAYLGIADAEDPADMNDVEAKLRKALERDDSLSRAHVELGAILLFRDLNWQGAEKELRRAIEVNPNDATAHQGYAYFLDSAGRLDEGMKEYQRAQESDPAEDHLGAPLYSRREYDRLIELERRALATNPPGNTDANAIAHKVLMVAYARTGKRKESIEEFRSALVCMGFDGFAEEMRRGYVVGGYQGALRAYLKGVKRHPDWVFHFVETYAYTELGDYDQAFARLPKLNDDPGAWGFVADPEGVTGVPTLMTLRLEPMWDPLHSDPRFEALARRIGLPAESGRSAKN